MDGSRFKQFPHTDQDDPAMALLPFELIQSENGGIPILISVPHGGRQYPPQILANMRDPDLRLRLEDRHADTLAREVAQICGAPLLVAKVPRAMIDLNRAPEDVDWDMIAGPKPERQRHSLANRRARSGLGIVPRKLPGTGEFWSTRLPRSELDERIEEIHRPYHQTLGAMLERIRARWGAALLIDLHSMPPLRRRHPGEAVCEFVVGDRFGASCDPRLVASALEYFGSAGRLAGHNRPYSGGYVLDRHGMPRRDIHAIQLEICRSSYLDSRLEEPCARLPALARLLAGMVSRLAGEVAELGSRQDLLQAGE